MTTWNFDRLHLAQIELVFPRLKGEGYKATSPTDHYYNCIAWAAEDQDRLWSPLPQGQGSGGYDSPYGDYWPPEVPRENTLDTWMKALAQMGYEGCDTPTLENEFQKIAIYVDDQNVPQHVARQLPNGHWTSKLGNEIDIEHNTLRALEGKDYGQATCFMKRRSVSAAL